MAQAAAAGALVYGYLAWSILPVAIAVWFSFNAGRSGSAGQGFSLRWYWQDPVLSVWNDPDLRALLHSLRLAVLTTLVAVPLRVAFAIGLDRWRRPAGRRPGFQVLLSFVLPEILLAVALLFLFTNLLKAVQLGTWARLWAWSPSSLPGDHLPGPRTLDRQRVRGGGHGPQRLPLKALRHVLLPLLSPAIFASAVLVFADVIDDFVLVRYLSADAASEPMSVKIYNTARPAPPRPSTPWPPSCWSRPCSPSPWASSSTAA